MTRIGRTASRALLIGTVLWAAALVWVAPYPPMVDLPQHAAQVALLRELLMGSSPWNDVVRLNFVTPYLIGYGLALPLTLVMPASAALKLLLTTAYLAFVGACIAIRKRLDGDERLDWLFIPAFFGFAWKWGFVTFLVAAPLGLVFLLVAINHADRPQRRGGLLLLAGVGLFFSHALVFVFSTAIGVLLLLITQQRWAVIRHLWPYAVLGLLCLVYFLILRTEQVVGASQDAPIWGPLWVRLISYPLFTWSTLDEDCFAWLGAIVLFAPFVLRAGLNWTHAPGMVPLGVLVLIWAVVPSFALKTAFLYERFALFLLPFYAFLFRRGPPGEKRPGDNLRSFLGQTIIAACCWSFLAAETQRLSRFGQESADFQAVLEVATPGRLALALVFDPTSHAAQNSYAYLHFPAWYQSEKAGFVEFSFAWFPPQIVRYRPERLPPVAPGFEMNPQQFDWELHQAWRYDFFFVRHATKAPPDLFRGAKCAITPLHTRGSWSLFSQRC